MKVSVMVNVTMKVKRVKVQKEELDTFVNHKIR